MKLVSLIPISKLIFSCVYPECSVVSRPVDIEKEAYNRLIKAYHLDLDSAHKFFDQEVAIIQERGNNLESYYFDGNKELDDYLEAMLSSFNTFSRLLSYKTDMNYLTFSELTLFRSILIFMIEAYNKSKKKREKDIIAYEKFMNKVSKSKRLIEEIALKYEDLESFKKDFESVLKVQGQYAHFWDYLSNVILSRLGFLMGCREDYARTELNFIAESFCLVSARKNQLSRDLSNYKKLDFDRVKHDQKVLSRYDVSAFIEE